MDECCESCGGGFASQCGCAVGSSCTKCNKHTRGKKVYCGDCVTKLGRVRELPFDHAEYDLVRGPVVDAFEYKRGGVSVSIDKEFLDSVCSNHNTKFSRTGSLSPLVIGHTIDGAQEHDQPQKVGYLHNWGTEPWVNPQGISTHAAFADHYVKKQNTIVVGGVPLKLSSKEVLERWPRRSGEVWFNTKEIDPHCLLGATAPERDLGILRLSSTGASGVTYESPGKLKMQPDAMQSAAELPIVKTMEAQVAQLTQMIQALTAALQSVQETQAAMQAAQQAMQAPPQEHGNDDEHFEDILRQLGIDSQGQQEPQGQPQDPDEAPEAPPGPPAKMQKEATTMPTPEALRVKELERELAVIKLSKRIDSIREEKGVDISSADKELIDDLLSMPPDMQERNFIRLEKGPKVPGFAPKSLEAALASDPAPEGKKSKGPEDTQKIMKLSREKQIPYEAAAAQLGYTLGL